MATGQLRRRELAEHFEAESQRAWELAVALAAQADLLHDQSTEQVERADFMRQMARIHRGREKDTSPVGDRAAEAVVEATRQSGTPKTAATTDPNRRESSDPVHEKESRPRTSTYV